MLRTSAETRDRHALETFFRADAGLHLYELGDLDDAFFSNTRWVVGRDEQSEIRAAVLLYSASAVHVLVAHARQPARAIELLRAGPVRALLPPRFYAHLGVGVAAAFDGWARLEPHGLHDRMILTRPEAARAADPGRAERLSPSDHAEVERFYQQAYPGNWFDPRTLETGACFAIREGSAIVAVSGVHVVSRTTRVAALGNVATRPEMRGRGLALAVCSATIQSLLAPSERGPSVDLVGLNVAADNDAAIRLYRRLGFERTASYEEASITIAAG